THFESGRGGLITPLGPGSVNPNEAQVKKDQFKTKPVLKTEPYEEDNPPLCASVYRPMAQDRQGPVPLQPANVDDGNNEVPRAGAQGI
ncbi:hypothetical protein E2320_002135, partial [Naja naja]